MKPRITEYKVMDVNTAIDLYWKNKASLTEVHDALKDAPYTPKTKPAINQALGAITKFKSNGCYFIDMIEAFDKVQKVFNR